MVDHVNEAGERLEYLFSQYISNKATRQEIKELATLLEDPQIEIHLSQVIEDDWKQFIPDIQLKAEHTDKLLSDIQSRIHKPSRSVSLFMRPQMVWRVAASIVLIAVFSALLLQYKGDFFGLAGVELVTMESPAGKRSKIVLPDGSTVWLNAESKLTYPQRFHHGKREITLQGEGFFEVVRNEHEPFIITSHDVSIKVLGTSFNVKAYDNEYAEVTVRTGKVEVEAHDKSRVQLTANQQISFSAQQGFSAVKQVDANDFMTWRDGVLLFDNKNLKQLASILERWYGKKIVIKNERLNTCQLVGRHENESLEEILASMQFILDIDYTSKGDTIMIDGKGCD
jgi:ferric-dicitrate binding protein FerR (iron transport regulator)